MDTDYPVRFTKHILKKLLRKPDPVWPLYDFEHSIHPETVSHHQEILSWAEQSLVNKDVFEKKEKYEQSSDPIVRQGYVLKQQVEKEFRNKRIDDADIRLLIQIPDPSVSPGGFSFFSNLADSLEFIGIPTYRLEWEGNTQKALEMFQPTYLLATDHEKFMGKINWDVIDAYRKHSVLHIGLLVHLEEYGGISLEQRIDWGEDHGVDFYFSMRDAAYTHTQKEYRPFFERGYSILTIPFGANPLCYYPLPHIERDLNYSFLASAQWMKGPVYSTLAKKVVARYPGFIDGIGWHHVKNFTFKKDRDRYIYARSKVGFNFHLPEQIEWAYEVNERTHQLAMCGVPQLIDAPKLLPKLYSEDALFVCRNGNEFTDHFECIIADPKYGEQRALKAQREVFSQHTTFHRADYFILQLQELFKKL